ncbi:MAG: hypothetical protein CMF59_17825 [Leptospiraceae bacterium]|nr:hypothetical protein [Leptospiraceae bacterium]
MQPEKAKWTRHVTVPNGLSVSRVLLGMPLWFALSSFAANPSLVNLWPLVLILTYAIVSDFLDGYLARKWGQTSSVGSYLDGMADHLLLLITLYQLWKEFEFPGWIIGLYLFREIYTIWIGLWLYRVRGRIGKSDLWGKLTINLAALTVLLYILEPLVSRGQVERTMFPEVSSMLLALLMLISMLSYFRRYLYPLIRGMDLSEVD